MNQAGAVVALTVMIVLIGLPLIFYIFNKAYWENGKFPPFLTNRAINKCEALINIAVYILVCSKEDYKNKQRYFQSFLYREFPSVTDSMADSLSVAVYQRLSIASTTSWLKKCTRDTAKLQEYLHVLFKMAVMDSLIQKNEMEILKSISDGFGLDRRILNQWIEEEIEKQQKINEHANRFESRSTVSRIKSRQYSVLTVEENATREEIKLAYRKLVKLYHPDKLQKESTAIQQEAKLKFMEIQEAYEMLTETDS